MAVALFNVFTSKFGRDVQEIFLVYLIGRSYVAVRTDDVAAWARFLAKFQRQDDQPRELHLVALGEAAIAALHAAALQPNLFASVRLKHMIRSWADLVAAADSHDQMVNVVHGVLKYYDLPQLVELAGKNRVTIEALLDAMANPVAP